jgi:hypothetical protein
MRLIVGYVRRNHLGLLALFIALGGTAYAATELKKNSVKSQNIAKEQVKRSDIAKDAINSPKVAPGSLLASDFAAGQLPQGPQGPTGPTGAPGVPGAPGKDAASLFAYIQDQGGGGTATVGYGKGVLGVSDPAGENNFISPYVVTFNKTLTECVGNATVGFGEPTGSGSGLIGTIMVDLEGSTARVFSFNAGGSAAQDTSFMLTIVC